jgi:hypothetical protein
MGISVSVALLRKLCCVLVENVENPEAELFGERGGRSALAALDRTSPYEYSTLRTSKERKQK